MGSDEEDQLVQGLRVKPNSESELTAETGTGWGGLWSGLAKRLASRPRAWVKDEDYRWDP